MADRLVSSGESRSSVLSWVVDAGVCAVVVAAFWSPPLSATQNRALVVVGLVLVAVLSASVLLRWKLPLIAPVTALTATLAGWAFGMSADPMLAAAWCLYPLALHRARHTRAVSLMAVGLLVFLATVMSTPSPDAVAGQRMVVAICALGASWLLGHVEARRLGAAKQAARDQERHEQSRRRAALAREVHDVVGHALSVISAEADVARSLPGSDERELRESLADIEHRSRDALGQVQALVRALRCDQPAVGELRTDPARVVLPQLVTAVRLSGVEAEARISLPPVAWETDRVVVRVVQEALSNVIRHARANWCELIVRSDGNAVLVSIDDDGRGLPASPRPGVGIQGMRERVEGVGGELAVTSRLEGGTRVLARLPLQVMA